MAGAVSRTFVINHNARTHTVQLQHNTILGDRALAIDGGEVLGTTGRTSMLSGPAYLAFTIGDGSGVVHITPAALEFRYSCEFNGLPVTEENQMPLEASDADCDRVKIAVERGDMCADEDGKPLILFVIHAQRESDLRETRVHRRFRDFFAVNEQVRTYLRNTPARKCGATLTAAPCCRA